MKPEFVRKAALLLCAGATATAAAQGPAQNFSAEPPSRDAFFQRGWHEATFSSGVLFSPFLATRDRPAINYTLSELQAGYMFTDLGGHGWLRGNFEAVGEAFGGAVIHGPGSAIAGATGWLRYNFVPRDWRLAPYAQAGAGLTYADVDRRMLGQTFNFNLNLGVGVRWFVASNWSVNLEYRYQHVSNANLSSHNVGINSEGPILGVSYFF